MKRSERLLFESRRVLLISIACAVVALALGAWAVAAWGHYSVPGGALLFLLAAAASVLALVFESEAARLRGLSLMEREWERRAKP